MAERHEFSGVAVVAELSTAINADTLTLAISASSGWPTGGVGTFGVVIDPDKSNEEKVVCSARSGTTITIQRRGADGTAASTHAVGATCYPVFMAEDADQANRHAADETLDDHEQYVHVDNSRTVTASNTYTGENFVEGDLHVSGDVDFSGKSDFADTATFQDFGADSDITVVKPSNTKSLGDDNRPASLKHVHSVDKQAFRDAMFEPGDIKFTAATTWASDWLEANGQEVSRTTYAKLFAALGSRAGAGNGTTTFTLPDYRDLVVSVAGQTKQFGVVNGQDTVTAGLANMPRHAHTVNDPGHKHGVGDPDDTGNRVVVTAASTLWLGNEGTPGHSQQVSYTGINKANTGISLNNTGGGTTTGDGKAEAMNIVNKNIPLRCLMKAA